jgi:hypothetical protein
MSSGKNHLVVLLHGVMGWPSHMKELSKELTTTFGSGVLAHSPSTFSRLKSLGGTQATGETVFDEVKGLVAKHKSTLKEISIVGYSFGGIVAWWVAGRLYSEDFLGLIPQNFVTIACPHLGATDPDASPVNMFQTIRSFFIRQAGGQTGSELSHRDEVGLLPWMADPASPFFAGLKAFQERILYANLRGDRTVPFQTSFFPAAGEPTEELPGRWCPADADCPHVLAWSPSPSPLSPGIEAMPVRVGAILVALLPLLFIWMCIAVPLMSVIIAVLSTCRCVRRWCSPPAPLPPDLAPPAGWTRIGRGQGVQKRMAEALNSLSWRKRAALFTWTRDGVAAVHTHGHIVVRHPRLNGFGADVIRSIARDMRLSSPLPPPLMAA